jgi:hypothetical protein
LNLCPLKIRQSATHFSNTFFYYCVLRKLVLFTLHSKHCGSFHVLFLDSCLRLSARLSFVNVRRTSFSIVRKPITLLCPSFVYFGPLFYATLEKGCGAANALILVACRFIETRTTSGVVVFQTARQRAMQVPASPAALYNR